MSYLSEMFLFYITNVIMFGSLIAPSLVDNINIHIDDNDLKVTMFLMNAEIQAKREGPKEHV